MKVRALYPLAAAAGLWMPSVGSAQQPARLSVAANNPNQVLADSVAAQLRTSGVAANSDVSIVAQEGVVTLSGFAKDAAQKDKIAAAVKSVRGVLVVRDVMNTPARGIVQVQDAPLPLAPIGPAPVGGGPGGPIGYGDSPQIEPVPLGASGQLPPDMGAPNLPPYSWPTYAPYNNVSRVAYPTAHPYNAFPFIGPYYPFPKVPLGWRKVTLEWEDGHWYLGRNTAPQDHWKVRFW